MPWVVFHLQEKHIALVEAVNNAKTTAEHQCAQAYLRAWRDGVKDMGGNLDYIACDLHYLDQGVDRPMCCGVFNDWKPADE